MERTNTETPQTVIHSHSRRIAANSCLEQLYSSCKLVKISEDHRVFAVIENEPAFFVDYSLCFSNNFSTSLFPMGKK